MSKSDMSYKQLVGYIAYESTNDYPNNKARREADAKTSVKMFASQRGYPLEKMLADVKVALVGAVSTYASNHR